MFVDGVLGFIIGAVILWMINNALKKMQEAIALQAQAITTLNGLVRKIDSELIGLANNMEKPKNNYKYVNSPKAYQSVLDGVEYDPFDEDD